MKNDKIAYSKYVLVRIVLILFNEHVFEVCKDLGSSKEKTFTYTSAKWLAGVSSKKWTIFWKQDRFFAFFSWFSQELRSTCRSCTVARKSLFTTAESFCSKVPALCKAIIQLSSSFIICMNFLPKLLKAYQIYIVGKSKY